MAYIICVLFQVFAGDGHWSVNASKTHISKESKATNQIKKNLTVKVPVESSDSKIDKKVETKTKDEKVMADAKIADLKEKSKIAHKDI